MIYADDRIQKPRPEEPSRQAPEEGGPRSPISAARSYRMSS